MDAYERRVCEELNRAVDGVLHDHFDFYFDREKAKRVLRDWAKAVVEDEAPTADSK